MQGFVARRIYFYSSTIRSARERQEAAKKQVIGGGFFPPQQQPLQETLAPRALTDTAEEETKESFLKSDTLGQATPSGVPENASSDTTPKTTPKSRPDLISGTTSADSGEMRHSWHICDASASQVKDRDSWFVRL